MKDGGKAIKAVAKVTKTTNHEQLIKLHGSVDLHRRLHTHDSVLKVYGVKEIKSELDSEDTQFVLLTEVAECSLRDILQPTTTEMFDLRKKLFAESDAVANGRINVIRQIFHGMSYIHSRTDERNDHISHRDVKPENLLPVSLERDGSYIIKFADFGSAKQMNIGENANITEGAFTPLYLDPNIARKLAKGEHVSIEDYLAADVY